MELGLFQKQSLKLVMTQELKQAIQLLQYSTTELVDYLQEVALENPLVEIKVDSSEPYPMYNKSTTPDTTNDFDPIEQLHFGKQSLTTYLHDQLSYLKLEPHLCSLVRQLILSLDENGYLDGEWADFTHAFNVSDSMLEDAVSILQQLDPPGIGARSLQECLLLQLQKNSDRSLLTEEIVSNYLNHLANKNWKVIEKDLHVTADQIKASFELIRTLDPKPGSKFSQEITQVIIPDLIMTNVDGIWLISVNDSIMPMIQLHREYGGLLKLEKGNDATPYLREKYKEFLWLKKSVEHRKVTLIKVMEAILERQPEFFNGNFKLSPLTLREIAEVTEVHESTVSRSVRNKYVQTPYGIFELKHFFSSGVKTDTGDITSSESVKQEIHEIVSRENKKKPLSDQKIAIHLKTKNGIIISRRTVAKYREQLNIPSSSKRKTF